jgi:hypothetical protein
MWNKKSSKIFQLFSEKIYGGASTYAAQLSGAFFALAAGALQLSSRPGTAVPTLQ